MHIDLSEPGLLDKRPARWLQLRIRTLLSMESRLREDFFPTEREEVIS